MRTLLKIHVLGLRQITRIIASVYTHGFTLLALLASVKNKKTGSIDDNYKQLSYKQLYEKAISLAYILNEEYCIKSKCKVVIVSSNSIKFVETLFAVSGLGADVFLLNPNQKKDYFSHFLTTQKIDLIICDTTIADYFEPYTIPLISFDKITALPSVNDIRNAVKRKKGNIIILSSGSKGRPSAEKRKLSVIKYLNPLIDIIEKLHLKENQSVLISVPVFHGYGLAALLISFFLVKRIYLTTKFDAHITLKLIEEKKTDCWIAVPIMIQKVYALPNVKFTQLKNIISGSDVLPPSTIDLVHKISQAKIYNMYGTSQTGVCTIATNNHLLMFTDTIGKPIRGIKMKILNNSGVIATNDTAGRLFVKCRWSSDSLNNNYMPTGDIVSKNKQGYYFYKGREDDLMIIGGENIYPKELEDVIYQNNKIAWVKAKAVTYDNRNKIHIDLVIRPNVDFSDEEFLGWITDRVPSYMIPKSIAILDTVPGIKLM